MPISPAPGRAISVAGLNKTSGWGSRDASGNLIAGHAPDQGIAHVQGLSESGLDISNNPLITTYAVTGITTTAATVTWTSAPSAPLGSVRVRALGAATSTTTNETGSPPLTAHSVALAGLTTNTVYDLLVTQPGAGAGASQGRTEFVLRFRTGPTGQVLGAPEQHPALSSPLDGAPTTTPAPSVEETGEAPGLEISGLEAEAQDATTVVVSWRTSAYATGIVRIREGTEALDDEPETGSKRMNHSVTVDGLGAGTTYHVRVESADAAGDTATSEEVEVTTPAA
jgi:Purple acid Phosphatase, N-terminal domain